MTSPEIKQNRSCTRSFTQSLQGELDQISEKCKSCKLCKKECAFLRKYGTPKEIADTFAFSSQQNSQMAFECSLCKLCNAVCPFDADPAALFLEMRRYAFHKGWGTSTQHNKLVNFEKRGTSKRYSLYALPKNCTTVLFPGCALSATRSATVKRLFSHLKTSDKNLGLVLDCCTKPSHDLGRDFYFQTMFNEMKQFLTKNGVTKVLVACPSCYAVFTKYGDGIDTKTVYQELLDIGLPAEVEGHYHKEGSIKATFHDSCTARFEEHIHHSVRALATKAGIDLEEMPHHGKKALCCGEGGGACFISPDFITNWKEMRKEEMNESLVLTYCAGCANFIGQKKTNHILDMIFSPEILKEKTAKVTKAPFTYLYRLALKRWAKRTIKIEIQRERGIIR